MWYSMCMPWLVICSVKKQKRSEVALVTADAPAFMREHRTGPVFYYVLGRWTPSFYFVIGIWVIQIEKVFTSFLLPPDNVLSQGQELHPSTCKVNRMPFPSWWFARISPGLTSSLACLMLDSLLFVSCLWRSGYMSTCMYWGHLISRCRRRADNDELESVGSFINFKSS